MPTDPVLTLIDAYAPALIALVLLVVAWRIARVLVPVRIPFGLVARLLRLVAVIAAAFVVLTYGGPRLTALPSPPIGWIVVIWLALGLPIYLIWRWYRSVDEREDHARRLEQARAHERRRAPAPLQGPPGGGALGAPPPPPPGGTP